jgi:hypothetical protein
MSFEHMPLVELKERSSFDLETLVWLVGVSYESAKQVKTECPMEFFGRLS